MELSKNKDENIAKEGIVQRLIEIKEKLAEETFLREFSYLKEENPQHYEELHDEIISHRPELAK